MTSFSARYYQFRIAKELGIIAGVIFVGIFTLSILQGRIVQSVLTIASSHSLANKENEELERFDYLRNELTATNDVYEGSLSALLPTEDIHTLTDAIQGLAGKHGVVVNFTASTPLPGPSNITLKLFSIDTSVQATGARSAVRAFISDLEKLPYFYSITHFSENYDEQRGTVNTQLSMRLWTKATQVLTNTNL